MDIELQLEKRNIWCVLVKKCNTQKCENIIALVREVGEYSINKLKTVVKHMSEFTLHDEVHIFNMLEIIDKLVPISVLEQLSIPNLMLIILAVFLHDIGMCPEEKYIKAWKAIIDPEDYGNLAQENLKYENFKKTYPRILEDINDLVEGGDFHKAILLEEFLLSEYIRKNHAQNAKEIIAKDWNNRIIYKNTDLLEVLINICYSHNENYTYILGMEPLILCDYDEYVCPQFIAVILRLADIIDFDPKRTPAILFSHLAVKNPVSIKEWKKHQSINAWTISQDMLVYSAQCEHPAIESSIRKFCDMIDNELSNCTLILSNLNSNLFRDEIQKYKIKLPVKVNRDQITAKKNVITNKSIYRYHDTIFSLNKEQVIDLLMGTKLYDNTEVALRELIQNSIDACMVRKILSSSYSELYVPKIKIKLYSSDNIDYLCVEDNGIGMDQYVIDNYYTRIGVSYYRSNEFYELMRTVKSDYKPISYFGIGILASFMVCDEMEINTRKVLGKYQYASALNILIEGYESLFIIKDGVREEPGTSTLLKLRKDHPWKDQDKEEFFESVKKAIPNPPFAIEIEHKNSKLIYEHSNFGRKSWEDFVCDNNWNDKRNVKFVDLLIEDEEYSFKGIVRIAYITERGRPSSYLQLPPHEIFIGNMRFQLWTRLIYNVFGILKSSSSLEVTENNKIEVVKSSNIILSSNSILSINGIGIPCNIFRTRNNLNQKTVLTFPLPVLLQLDVGQKTVLNLNTARTQIIYDDDWRKFEKRLIKVICTQLSLKEMEDWPYLKEVIINRLVDNEIKEIISKI